MAKAGEHTVGDVPVHDVNNVNIVSRGAPETDDERQELMNQHPWSEQRPGLDPHSDKLDESLDTTHNEAASAEVRAYRKAQDTGETTVAGRIDKPKASEPKKGG